MKVFSEESALQLSEMLLQNDKNIKTEIEGKIPSVDGLATKQYVDNSIKNVKVDLTGYATETYVNNAIANAQLSGGDTNVDLSGYATKDDLKGYAAKEHTHNEYLTEHQDLSDYALKSEIPTDYLSSIPEEYVTETELSAKGYLTEHQDISELVNKSHNHDNKSVIDKFSVSDSGILLFDGSEIKGSSTTTGNDGKSAYEIAVDNGFIGTETEWLESLKGDKGEPGADGVTPNLTIGTVETLEAGSAATATITGDKENPVLNLGIPKGADGQGGSGGSASTVDILEGKKIAFVGDSITYGTGSVVVKDIRCDGYYNPYSPKISYPEIIKELHPNALVYNYAQAGLAIGENTSGSNLIAILDSLISAVSDVDYLVLSGGVNDAWVSGTTLGSLSDSYGGNYDKTTFYGALEQYVYNAINAYPNAYIMFLMTHNDIKKDYGSGVVNMNDVIREVCEKWKIKLLDLNKNIGVNLSISPYKDKYMSDSTHPNEQCYRKFYAPLCNEEILSYGIDTSVSSGTGDGGSGGDDNVTIMGITATKTKTVYVVGDTYSDSDITVTANYSDGTTVDVTSDSTINSSDVNTSEEGTYTVNVEYSVDGISYTDSITITVSNSQSSDWDDSVVLSEIWSNATFANTTISQRSGTNRVTGTIMSDKTIKSVTLKLVSEFVVVDLTANEPYTIDAEFTGNMNYTGNIVATAKGSGDYPVTLYIKDFAIT